MCACVRYVRAFSRTRVDLGPPTMMREDAKCCQRESGGGKRVGQRREQGGGESGGYGMIPWACGDRFVCVCVGERDRAPHCVCVCVRARTYENGRRRR